MTAPPLSKPSAVCGCCAPTAPARSGRAPGTPGPSSGWGPVRTESGWYLGRPVVVTENDYSLDLFNGDTGVAVARAEGGLSVAFRRAGTVVTVSPARLAAVQTAFAMTAHRAQGSEFDQVVVLLPAPTSRVLTRELLFTAVTRARRQLVLVGTEESVRAALRRPIARASGLTAAFGPERPGLRLGRRYWAPGRQPLPCLLCKSPSLQRKSPGPRRLDERPSEAERRLGKAAGGHLFAGPRLEPRRHGADRRLAERRLRTGAGARRRVPGPRPLHRRGRPFGARRARREASRRRGRLRVGAVGRRQPGPGRPGPGQRPGPAAGARWPARRQRRWRTGSGTRSGTTRCRSTTASAPFRRWARPPSPTSASPRASSTPGP